MVRAVIRIGKLGLGAHVCDEDQKNIKCPPDVKLFSRLTQ